ncbi:MAG: addiction module protein [Verrucomicrobiae bacterium]|nr:addiction module protein [Verrucomicrobiae bacterium]
MTLDQIVEEAHHLPATQVAELVDRLTLDLHHAVDPSIEEAWKKETQRRWNEIESGREKGVSSEEMKGRIRGILSR